MLQGHNRTHRSHVIGMVRDIVEIVAIVAAGIWAFYVFVYENRIVPSLAQPKVNFSASLQKVSQHDGLVGVRLEVSARNVGTVHAHFLAVATAVAGQNVQRITTSTQPAANDNSISYDAFYRTSKAVPVYESGFVTSLGDPQTPKDFALEPGNEYVVENRVFYVPVHRFDLLRAYLVTRYTRYDDKPISTKLVVNKDGLPSLQGDHENVFQYNSFLTSIDLNGP